IGELELVPDSATPVYPVHITSTSVLADPFGDIVPRTTPLERKLLAEQKKIQEEAKAAEIARRHAKKLKKNKKLLSFGAEDDGEEEDIPRKHVKSSHDLPENAGTLLAASVAAPVVSATTAAASTIPPPAAMAPPAPAETSALFAQEKAARAATLATEIDAVKRSILRSRAGPKTRRERRTKTRHLDALRAPYTTVSHRPTRIIETRAGAASKAPLRRAVEDEAGLLDRLDAFRRRISAAPILEQRTRVPVVMPEEEARMCVVHRVLDCGSCNAAAARTGAGEEEGDDEGWMENSLVFKKDTRANVYERKLDDYTYLDPRTERGI
ncbi:MAG: hypothetical protein SGCHY_001685, partial [Lobulomycetales sp.]